MAIMETLEAVHLARGADQQRTFAAAAAAEDPLNDPIFRVLPYWAGATGLAVVLVVLFHALPFAPPARRRRQRNRLAL